MTKSKIPLIAGKLFILVMLLLVGVPAFAQSVDTAWVRRYNGPGDARDASYAIAVDGSGNVYVTGFSEVAAYNSDWATIKYYPNGDTAWLRRYNGPANAGDEARDIGVDGSGNVYVTGFSGGSGTQADYTTIKYYPNGDTAWVRRYNGPTSSRDASYSIALDYFGNVYVTGGSIGSGTHRDYATIKYVQFLCGDVNKDGAVDISDIVYLTNYLFIPGSPPPNPIQAGDVNLDGAVNITDVVYLINYLFAGGPPPCSE